MRKYMSVGGDLTDDVEEAFLYKKYILCEKLKKSLEEAPDLKSSVFEIEQIGITLES